MPRIPIFKLGGSAEEPSPPQLTSYTPVLSLEGLQLGVDNLRHDVFLSAKFTEPMRLHVARLIVRHGNVEGLLAAEAPQNPGGNQFLRPAGAKTRDDSDPSDLKPLMAALHVSALNRAKTAGSLSIDLLARVAIVKFLRTELNSQFSQLVERCRMMLKTYEGVRQQKAMEYRERVGEFQVAKKTILRKAGLELLHTLREIEKETLGRMRQSLFGRRGDAEYKLFLNPLLFSEDARDTYLNAEHYVMVGTFDRDPDCFAEVRRLTCEFLQSPRPRPRCAGRRTFSMAGSTRRKTRRNWSAALVPTRTPAKAAPARPACRTGWSRLDSAKVLERVVASYEAVPLLAEYSPRIHAQQLKNALINREERDRVEKLIKDHGRLSTASLTAAVSRVSSCKGAARGKMAGRYLRDFLRYHRDLRRLEALNSASDSVNLVTTDKMRELSALNGTLYEFLLADEQKPAEASVARHVVIKADVRDSTRLTRSLLERGMNPASYFSLNFYDPVNKLLTKYGATKVFLEGDAIILALLENVGENSHAVGHACALAREIIDIVQGYNLLLERGGLPFLELGIGISFQDSAPMYLMDGTQRIMISDALNESDRLSSCNKKVRGVVEKLKSPFNVYAFQAAIEGAEPSDEIMSYNLSGIRMSEAAFQQLQEEIKLEACHLDLPQLWGTEEHSLYSALIPLGKDIFRKMVVRASRVPQIDPRNFSLRKWTDIRYYEVCANPAVYAALEGKAAAGK